MHWLIIMFLWFPVNMAVVWVYTILEQPYQPFQLLVRDIPMKYPYAVWFMFSLFSYYMPHGARICINIYHKHGSNIHIQWLEHMFKQPCTCHIQKSCPIISLLWPLLKAMSLNTWLCWANCFIHHNREIYKICEKLSWGDIGWNDTDKNGPWTLIPILFIYVYILLYIIIYLYVRLPPIIVYYSSIFISIKWCFQSFFHGNLRIFPLIFPGSRPFKRSSRPKPPNPSARWPASFLGDAVTVEGKDGTTRIFGKMASWTPVLDHQRGCSAIFCWKNCCCCFWKMARTVCGKSIFLVGIAMNAAFHLVPSVDLTGSMSSSVGKPRAHWLIETCQDA